MFPATEPGSSKAMLERHQKLALFMEGAVLGDTGKMGFGILRYSPNPVACVIDSQTAGQDIQKLCGSPRPAPIVSSVQEALALGADVFVLGIAPHGGLIPVDWYAAIDAAWEGGMSLLNGLHEKLGPRYHERPGQWIWDIRIEAPGIKPGEGQAASLNNRRLMMIGTDMAVGKMTAGLEIWKCARDRGIDAEFIATGQIGITVTGRGVPLDAVRVDFASGSIEGEVMKTASHPLVIVEGQGSLIHPGSTANLPLMRGSCPTHFVLCVRAGQTHLLRVPWVKIPPLGDFIRMYEDLGEACGTFQRPQTVGVCMNAAHLSPEDGESARKALEDELGLPVVDPVNQTTDRIVDRLMAP